mgnify:CR=1 FL=1
MAGRKELITIDTSIESDAATQEKINQFTVAIDDKYLSQFGYTKDQVLCTNEIDFANKLSISIIPNSSTICITLES